MASVADLIVRRLCDAGVAALFGMPGGGSNLDLVEAAGRAGLPFVLTATETGGAIAAIAQAEITGRPGACLTTLGPGVSSVVNGVACAFLDRAPLIVFTDRHPAGAASFEHQTLDHRALLAPVTKWSATLSAESVEQVLSEAIERAIAWPPGPVHIDVPSDVASVSGLRFPVDQIPLGASQPDASSRLVIDELATGDRPLVTGATRPLLLLGLGARRSADAAAIRAFCAAHKVPALVTYKAKGVVPDADPHFAGVFTNAAIERPILEKADLLIAVGLDPVELLPRPWTLRAPVVSIAPWQISSAQLPVSAHYIGDIAAGLREVAALVASADWDFDALRTHVRAQQDGVRATGDGLTPDRVVQAAARAASAVRVAVDAGAHMFPATVLWPVAEPNGMLISNGLSTMGFALPAAIGAALLDRTRPVVALTGDGGLLICAGELLTAAREGLRVVTVVLSDASLSLIAIKQQQRRLSPSGVALGDVAWCALAESFGVPAQFAATETDLERALVTALERTGPSLIEARVDPSAYGDVLRAIRG